MYWLITPIPLQSQNTRSFRIIRVILHKFGLFHTSKDISNKDAVSLELLETVNRHCHVVTGYKIENTIKSLTHLLTNNAGNTARILP